MPLVKKASHESRPLKSLAVYALGLYLLVNAFLILCLVHPHNAHLQDHADNYPASVCEWVYKTVSSHAPSSRILLPFAAAILLILLPPPPHAPQISPVSLTGRSPPLPAFA